MKLAGVATGFAGLDALLLECNHDAALLAAGPYPEFLKARVPITLLTLAVGWAWLAALP